MHWRGKENDTAGDGYYATFDGPARSIHCAMEIQDRVRDLGIARPITRRPNPDGGSLSLTARLLVPRAAVR